MGQYQKTGAVTKSVSTKSIVRVVSAFAWFSWLVGWSVKLLLVLTAQSFLISGLLEIHDQ
jgi:hypothetical protein